MEVSFLESLSVGGLMNANGQEFLGKGLLCFRCRRRGTVFHLAHSSKPRFLAPDADLEQYLADLALAKGVISPAVHRHIRERMATDATSE
jgi:hypothetical protein